MDVGAGLALPHRGAGIAHELTRMIRKKGKGAKQIRLGIEVKDFGPISGGKISLAPLTVFIGPNNSGKSYAAMLVRSIFQSYTSYTSYPALYLPLGDTWDLAVRIPPIVHWAYAAPDRIENIRKEFGEFVGKIRKLNFNDELNVPAGLLESMTRNFFETIYEEKLSDEIVKSYACPMEELIKAGAAAFSLNIDFDSHGSRLLYEKEKNKLNLKLFSTPDTPFAIKIVRSPGELPTGSWNMEYEEKGDVGFIRARGGKDFPEIEPLLFNNIANACCGHALRDVAMPSYYLPAARSGMLQGYKALAASIVRQAPYAGIGQMEVPKFSGVVAEFLSSIIDLPGKPGPLYSLAQDLERKITKGEILVATKEKYVPAEIKYRFGETEIPLHRASSTVSELAPLVLYLKYKVRPDTLLIIEEPEAHLHPANQRILAKYLVRLIRKGVNILITTHSEFLLEQLNNFVMLSKVEPAQRAKKYDYEETDFIKPDEISAYVFRYDKRSKGHKVDRVEISEEGGISQEEFIKIDESLYEETLKLRRDLAPDDWRG